MFFAGMWFDSALEHHQPTLGKQPDFSINTARRKPILTRNLKPDVRFTPPQSKIDQKETSAVFGNRSVSNMRTGLDPEQPKCATVSPVVNPTGGNP